MEEYFFLGKANNVYFFFHNVSNKSFDKNISHQLYNVLIIDKIIIDFTENVIIYEFNKYNNTCNCICIYHNSNKSKPIFYKDNLAEYFEILFNAERNDIYVITYTYSSGNFFSCDINEKISFNNILKMPNEKLKIDELIEIETLFV